MKRILLATLACALTTLVSAQETTFSYSLTPTNPIPDGNPVGLANVFNVSGLDGAVADVKIDLNITGGFNGNLYAYLVDPMGNFAVLLNRVGLSSINPAGYGDGGFNITLDSAAENDIHNYQSGSYTISGGQLIGTWSADGRNIDPQSSGTVFDTAVANATLSVFTGLNGASENGSWTLFVADLSSGGGLAVLNNAALSITVVPEPGELAIASLGGLLLILINSKRLKRPL